MTRGIGDILNLFQKVKALKDGEYQALCPAHTDKTPSLHIRQEADHILINCKAGCTTEAIVESIGLQMADLFITNESKPVATKTKVKESEIGKIVATYDYKDEQGNLLYQVVRYDPKSFRQRHKNGGGEWVWDMKDVRRVLYRLPEILKADTLYHCEGEKDADTLWDFGQPATTSVGGANNWDPEYAEYLKGKKVIIIPDRDAPGMEYARQVAQSLEGKATSVKVILLDKKDITEWIETGGDVAQLPAMEHDVSKLFERDSLCYEFRDENIIWKKKVENISLIFKAERIREEKTGIHARVSISTMNQMLSWSLFNVERGEDRVRLANSAYKALKGHIETDKYSEANFKADLDEFCAGLWEFYVSRFVPEAMSGNNDSPLQYLLKPYLVDNGGTILFARPGAGKSYTSLLWAISVDAGCNKFWGVRQTNVLFINLERSKQSLARRVAHVNQALGLPANRPLFTLNARGRSLYDVLPTCQKFIKGQNIGLIVLDSISRAGYGDLNDNQAGNRIIDALSAMCGSWLALGHVSKSSEERIFGSVMQEAGADICVQLSSQSNDEKNMLGIGWEVTKTNDTARVLQSIFALEFNDNGLCNVREAIEGEFIEIEGKRKKSMGSAVIDFILNQDTADATATEIEAMTGFSRVNVCNLLNKNNGKFCKTRKDGRNQYYGVKDRKHDV
jgi:5S rRNA maturation endonuclease (ribonuclease M5)